MAKASTQQPTASCQDSATQNKTIVPSDNADTCPNPLEAHRVPNLPGSSLTDGHDAPTSVIICDAGSPKDNANPSEPGLDKGPQRGKRQWGPELYEFFCEHLLSIKNFDPNGLTEKLTIAWLTPTASKLRKASQKC